MTTVYYIKYTVYNNTKYNIFNNNLHQVKHIINYEDILYEM